MKPRHLQSKEKNTLQVLQLPIRQFLTLIPRHPPSPSLSSERQHQQPPKPRRLLTDDDTARTLDDNAPLSHRRSSPTPPPTHSCPFPQLTAPEEQFLGKRAVILKWEKNTYDTEDEW
ncbi:hypothetical protein Dimus_016876 [Dionaea muscipula]